MPNVVLTPHLGSAVLELREGMANVVVDNHRADRGGAPLELHQSGGVSAWARHCAGGQAAEEARPLESARAGLRPRPG